MVTLYEDHKQKTNCYSTDELSFNKSILGVLFMYSWNEIPQMSI